MSWDQLLIVLSTIVAGLAVAGWSARGLRRMWHLGRKLNRWLDQALGDKAAGLPSLMERVEAIETKLDDHLTWHANPGGRPARAALPRPNGPQSQHRP